MERNKVLWVRTREWPCGSILLRIRVAIMGTCLAQKEMKWNIARHNFTWFPWFHDCNCHHIIIIIHHISQIWSHPLKPTKTTIKDVMCIYIYINIYIYIYNPQPYLTPHFTRCFAFLVTLTRWLTFDSPTPLRHWDFWLRTSCPESFQHFMARGRCGLGVQPWWF